MKKIALFGSDFPSLSERAELDPFWFWTCNAFETHSFSILSRCPPLCLLACAFLVVTFLLLPSFFGLFPAVWASCLLACAFLAVACLRCPVRLAFGRLWFLPAWLGVSGCTLPAFSCLARFLPSAVPTWLGVPGCYLPALSCLARFLPSLVCTCLVGTQECREPTAALEQL